MSDLFWQDKKVLVTGADGFIGSQLAAELVSQGARVYAMIFNPNKPLNPILAAVKDRLAEIVIGDVRDFKFLSDFFTAKEIDTVFHLAAQPIVSLAFADPLPTFEINIWGSINILEASRRSAHLERLVIASTTHVYGDNKNLPYLGSYFPQPS
ncbi:MAG: GDP-mannose 4,6-dehydratase, partial [Patescibacteria group bacterium]